MGVDDMATAVTVTKTQRSGFSAGNGESTVSQFMRAAPYKVTSGASSPPAAVYQRLKKKFPIDMENAGKGPSPWASTSQAHFGNPAEDSRHSHESSTQQKETRVVYTAPEASCFAVKVAAPWMDPIQDRPKRPLTAYQLKRMQHVNHIEAEHD